MNRAILCNLLFCLPLGAFGQEKINRAYAAEAAKRGLESLKRGEYARAIGAMTEAIEIDASFDIPYVLRGSAYFELKQYDKALDDCERAITLKPGAEVYRLRAELHRLRKQFEQSLADATRAIELDPRQADSYRQRGLAQEALGKNVEAIADYSRAIELEPKVETFLRRARLRLIQKEHDAAVDDCSRVLDLEASNGIALSYRAEAYLALGQYERALADSSRAIKLDPRNGGLFILRSEVYHFLKKEAEALADCARSIELNPRDPVVYLIRGDLHQEANATTRRRPITPGSSRSTRSK
jgi:tetratricopeptide (TPR) repeat protein